MRHEFRIIFLVIAKSIIRLPSRRLFGCRVERLEIFQYLTEIFQYSTKIFTAMIFFCDRANAVSGKSLAHM
jgi:hypothetical protein